MCYVIHAIEPKIWFCHSNRFSNSITIPTMTKSNYFPVTFQLQDLNLRRVMT